MIHLIIYRKTNNDLIFRLTYYVYYRIHDITGMGWYVVTIQTYYYGKFYTEQTLYEILMDKNRKHRLKLKKREKIARKIDFIKSIFQ